MENEGDPKLLAQSHEARWSDNAIVERLIDERETTPWSMAKQCAWLGEAVEGPGILWRSNALEELVKRSRRCGPHTSLDSAWDCL